MTIVWGLLGLGFLVFFHETGHFIAARLFGVKVETFSVGMGPVLLHHRFGDTDYRLSLIPFGGYCGMKGEKDYQKALDENSQCITGEKDSFYGIHPLKRLVIAFAGPLFNLFFAFICLTVTAMIGYTSQTYGPKIKIASEVPEFSDVYCPSKEAGMKTGDVILSVDGTEIKTFNDIISTVGLHGDEVLTIKVKRDSEISDIKVHAVLDKSTGIGKIGVVAADDSIITVNYGPYKFFPAMEQGFLETVKMIAVTVKAIGTLFKGVDVTQVLSGPARIISMFGETVNEGFSYGIKAGILDTLSLLTIISISLFLSNLLPIPVLDGGLILFSLIEFYSKKKIHPKVLYYIQIAGVTIIALLMTLAIIGDLRYFFIKQA